MAGRRRDYGGLAQGLNLLSAGIVQDAEDRRKFNERLQAAGITQGIKSRTIHPTFQDGQFTGFGQTTPKPAVDFSQVLGQLDQAGTHDYRLSMDSTGKQQLTILPKRTNRQTDPLQRANQMALLQSKIQGIEQRNALAPQLAMQSRLQSYPPPTAGFGGYIENKPNWFQSLLGEQQRPLAPALRTTDTTFLNQQLQQAMGGMPTTAPETGMPTDAIAQRIQALRAQGVPDQTIAQHLREKGVDPSQYGL